MFPEWQNKQKRKNEFWPCPTCNDSILTKPSVMARQEVGSWAGKGWTKGVPASLIIPNLRLNFMLLRPLCSSMREGDSQAFEPHTSASRNETIGYAPLSTINSTSSGLPPLHPLTQLWIIGRLGTTGQRLLALSPVKCAGWAGCLWLGQACFSKRKGAKPHLEKWACSSIT